MPPASLYTPQSITKKSKVTLTVGPVHNIIVIVAGTSDPGNTSDKKRSNSDPSKTPAGQESNWYWEGNEQLRKDLDALVEEHKKFNAALFVAHGWTGDNAIMNRQVSGAYLVDRLCGSSGEKPYYEKHLKSEVWFHLIGHSHGGNVINEMTQRMSTCKEWPAKWQVKTIVYLSTPFFNKLHKLNTTRLHPGCRIVNVFDKYDLTQRVIADFSLEQLPNAMDATGAAKNKILPLIEELMAFDTAAVSTGLQSTRLRDFDDRKWHVDLVLAMDPAQGAAMYRACLVLFQKLDELLLEVKAVIASLNKKVTFKVTKALEGKVPNERKIVSDALKKRFDERLDAIRDGLAPTVQAFQARLRGTRYPISGLIDDLFLNRFIPPLVDLLAVGGPQENGRLPDPPAPENSLLDLLVDLLLEQIGEFDDTRSAPNHQLAGTPFQHRIVPVDVTSEDDLDDHKECVAAFNTFIAHMERVEARYQKSRSKADLVDLIFTLLAQFEPLQSSVGKLDGLINMLTVADYLNFGDDDFDQMVEDLLGTMENYRAILRARQFGSIQAAGAEPDAKYDSHRLGDLEYLMMVSHSLSRQKLYPKVKEILQLQIRS